MGIERILIVRTDRVGDVLLSTPVVTALRRRYPRAHLAALVSSYAQDVIRGHPDVDEVICDHRLGKHAGLRGFCRLLGEIKSRSFDAALVLRPTWRVALLIYLAGIGIRVGTGYRAYQFLFNRRVYEHRSSWGKHEVEHNLSLARVLGASEEGFSTRMTFSRSDQGTVRKLLADWSVMPQERLVLVHPGSGGSARDWTIQGFAGLADRLMENGTASVVLSGGISDEQVVSRVEGLMRQRPLTFPHSLSLKELAALIARCQLVVTNSTGPMHMASAVGTPVVALFSPLRSCSPQRWGPWGGKHRVIMPSVPSCARCRGKRCRYYDCMAMISVEEVYAASRKMLDAQDDPAEPADVAGG